MRKRILSRLRKFISCSDSGPHMSQPIGVDVREEYANAFRTESYIDFWTRVLALNEGEPKPMAQLPVETTTAARLPSYRLFAEHLLDPDQPTVKKILALPSGRHRPNYYSFLSNYFSHTASASLLCGRLLKNIDHILVRHHPLKITMQSLDNTEFYHDCHFEPVLTDHNPFAPSASSTSRVRIIQNSCSELLKQLEFSRDVARAKLRRVRYFKRGSIGFFAALTASLTIIVVTHGIALILATPGLLVASIELAKQMKLAKEVSRLDAAAKGTYTLNRDLDTIGRLVARLNHELEHMKVMTRFWLEKRGDSRQAISEVARQLKLSHASFSQQLDELEEHLYLCVMTINRARTLVVKEILDPGQPTKAPCILS